MVYQVRLGNYFLRKSALSQRYCSTSFKGLHLRQIKLNCRKTADVGHILKWINKQKAILLISTNVHLSLCSWNNEMDQASMNDRLEIFISSLIFIQANGNFNQNYGNNSNQKNSELLSAIHSHADNAILKLDDLHGQMSVVEYSTLYSVSIYDSICKKTCDLTVL